MHQPRAAPCRAGTAPWGPQTQVTVLEELLSSSTAVPALSPHGMQWDTAHRAAPLPARLPAAARTTGLWMQDKKKPGSN